MALDDYLVLHMPFDEADGATSTYDYSKNRADGVVLEHILNRVKVVIALDLMVLANVRFLNRYWL